MLKLGRKFVPCGLLSLKIFDDPDAVSGASSTTAKSIVEDQQNQPTGWDRLYSMYSVDEFGTHSPELHIVYQTAFFGTFVGACIGGVIHSKAAYMNFMESNQATAFQSHLDAKKTLQDQVSIAFAKGAFKWGWRLGLFSTTYMLVTTSLSVYRGKSSLLEYTAAGAVTGTLYKMNLGPKGMLFGGLAGGLLGLLAGGFTLVLLDFTGASMESMRFWHYKWKQDRDQRERDMMHARDEQNHSELLKAHNRKYGPAGESLSALDDGTPTSQSQR